MYTRITYETKNIIIDNLNSYKVEWNSGEYSVLAGSGLSPSFRYFQSFLDENFDKIEYEYFTLSNSLELVDYFKQINLKEKINKLTFIFKNREFIEVIKSWDQSIQDEFEQFLPKSKKGKIRAWYLPEPDNNDSQMSEPEIPFTKQQFDKLYNRLPQQEPAIKDLEAKNLEELYRLFTPYQSDKENALWDGSLLMIKRDDKNVFSGKLVAYYAENDEELAWGNSQYEEKWLATITERMKSIYEAIRLKTHETYPAINWDSIFLTLHKDGSIEVNYELKGEEVYLGE